VEIPVLTKFVEGLKLFLASKRLKWLTLVFMVGTVAIYAMERIIAFLAIPSLSLAVTLIGGLFPIFFLIVTILSVLGLQRYVASDEEYKRSLVFWFVWMFVGIILLVLFIMVLPVFLAVVFVGFFVWIGFQAYFSTRTSLGIASGVELQHRSKITTFLFGFANIFNYFILIVAFIGTIILDTIQVPAVVVPSGALFGAALGLIFALLFNFLNGIIIVRERTKPTADNLTLLGIFISFYSAYFIYNVLKGVDLGVDITGIAITAFFILYTMSGVGRSLSSRSDMDTRWKLSKELAASFTFFIASCYIFVDVSFTTLAVAAGATPEAVAPWSDILKLWIFPFIALVMELLYIRKAGKPIEIPASEYELPPEPEAPAKEVPEEPTNEDEEAEPLDETVEPVEEEE
jgi:hypothetical protein